jgi:tetratricopeptide (TPR) repeat protein
MMQRLRLAGLVLALLTTSHAYGQEESWQSCFDTGQQHYQAGRFAQAEKLLQRAVDLAPRNSVSLADSWNWLGLARWKRGNYPEAEAAYGQARPLYKKLRGEHSAPFAYSTNNLGLVYWYQGRLKEGDELLNQALMILEKTEGDKGINLARALNNTGGLYQNKGYWKKAEPLLQRSKEIWEFRAFSHGDAAHVYLNLARMRAKQGKLTEAAELSQKALDVTKNRLPPQHPQVGECWCYLGNLHREQGKLEAADKALHEGMKILEKGLPEEHSSRADALSHLAALRHAQGKKQEAQKLFEQALATWAKQTVQPPGAALTHLRFARLCSESGRAPQASEHFQSALTIFEKSIGAIHPDVAETLERYAKLLHSTNVTQAAKMKDRAAAIRKQHADENK